MKRISRLWTATITSAALAVLAIACSSPPSKPPALRPADKEEPAQPPQKALVLAAPGTLNPTTTDSTHDAEPIRVVEPPERQVTPEQRAKNPKVVCARDRLSRECEDAVAPVLDALDRRKATFMKMEFPKGAGQDGRVTARTLKRGLMSKLKTLARLQSGYESVAVFGSPRPTVSAALSVGEIYQDTADFLRRTPAPAGVDRPDLVEAFRQEMENQALIVEGKANAAYDKALQLADELGVQSPSITTLRAVRRKR